MGHSEVAQNELSVTVILSLQKVANKIDNQESAELKFYQGQRRTDSISISGSFLLHIVPTLLHIAPTLHVGAEIKASPIRHRRDTPLSTHCLHITQVFDEIFHFEPKTSLHQENITRHRCRPGAPLD